MASSIGAVVVFILLVILSCLFFKFRREKSKKKEAIENAHKVAKWTKKVIIERQNSATSGTEGLTFPNVRMEKVRIEKPGWRDTEDSGECLSEYEFTLDCEWEFPRDLLDLGEVLGEGAFGKVTKGLAHCSLLQEEGSLDQDTTVETVTVAVKMLKEGHTDAEMIDFVKEMEIMKQIG